MGRLKSDLFNKMEWKFFQAVTMSVLLYDCTTWTLINYLEKKFSGKYTRMLHAVWNKSWKQHLKKQFGLILWQQL